MGGLWNTPGWPHRGWEVVRTRDLEDLSGECQFCLTRIRYEHLITHSEVTSGAVVVGAICCEHLMTEYSQKKAREALRVLKRDAKRRANEAEWMDILTWRPAWSEPDKLLRQEGHVRFYKSGPAQRSALVYRPRTNALWHWFVSARYYGFVKTALEAQRAAFYAVFR